MTQSPAPAIPNAFAALGTLDTLDVVLAFSQLRVQNARAIGSLSASYSISPTDMRAVSFISLTEGATPKLTADHLGLTTGAMTTLADRLERAGLVTRAANPSDRRSLLLRVTPRGAEMMAEVNELYIRAFSEAFDPADMPRMREAFLELAESLGRLAREREPGLGLGAAAD